MSKKYPGNDFKKRQKFSHRQNVDNVSADVILAGKLFQICRPTSREGGNSWHQHGQHYQTVSAGKGTRWKLLYNILMEAAQTQNIYHAKTATYGAI